MVYPGARLLWLAVVTCRTLGGQDLAALRVWARLMVSLRDVRVPVRVAFLAFLAGAVWGCRAGGGGRAYLSRRWAYPCGVRDQGLALALLFGAWRCGHWGQ